MVIQMKRPGQTEAIFFFRKRVNVWSKLVEPHTRWPKLNCKSQGYLLWLPPNSFGVSHCESEFETAARKIFIDGRLGSTSVLDSLLWPATGDKNNTRSLQKSRVSSSLSFIKQDDNYKVKDQINRVLDSLLWLASG